MATLQSTLRWVVLASVFALPFIVFIVASTLYFPFITGKNFAFRIIVEIMAGAYLALALLDGAYRPKRSWLLGAFTLFIFVVLAADLLGVYPFKSIWSNFERMDGWITLAHLFLYFVVAASVLNTEKLWRRFWHTSLGVAAVVAVYGLLQVAGVASLNPGFSSAARIDATFGNPIYLAVYMLFHIGIAALLWAGSVAQRRKGTGIAVTVLYGGAIALFTLILFMTGTRGAMLGLIGGLSLTALLVGLTSVEWRRTALVGLCVLAVTAGGFFLVRDQAWVKGIPYIERLATISLSDTTIQARFMNWGMAWEGVKERPLLGWGQENYAVVFDKYYDPRMYAQEQWFDRVHNIIFDWLVAAGFLGLFSYLSLFAAALWLMWRKANEAFTPPEKSVLTGILAAYFIGNFTVFDNITSYLLFTSILAFIAWRASKDGLTLTLPRIPKNIGVFVVVGALLLVWGIAWIVNGRALAANRALLDGLQSQSAGAQRNLELFRESISLRTTGVQEAREQLVQTSVQLAGVDAPLELKQDFYSASVEEMNAMMQEAPLNARFPLFLGIVHRAYGNFDEAEAALVKAHELSPNKQTILFELGSTRFAAGDTEGALEVFKQAFDLAPEFLTARLNYAAIAIRAGDDALADELLEPVLGDGAADPRIAAAYVSRARYDKIVQIWDAEIAANPTNAQAYFTLAAAHFEMGNSSAAIQALQDVGEIVPTAKQQADALIEQIRSGTLEI